MNANYQKYLAIWTRYYSKNEFGGASVEAAAAYAAMDNMNKCKCWSHAEIDDDLAYWEQKVGK
jgi:hypothetical protein